jgi:hypothetical protein
MNNTLTVFSTIAVAMIEIVRVEAAIIAGCVI